MMHRLEGKIKSGFGEARFWTNKISKVFEEKYNIKIFPGTLNIEIGQEYILDKNEKILPQEYNGDYEVLVQKCKIFESVAYIVRPEINNRKGGAHPLNIIELVSDQNLRKTYNLKDNDKVEIEI